MISFSRALAAGALLAGAVHAGSDFFVQNQVRTLEYSRVDPLVNPGANGEHVHTVVGGSAFSPYSTSPDSLEKSKCSSSSVQDDKSIYWSPSLYYVHSNGSYSLIPSSSRVYYFLKAGDGTTPVKAFPRGHRMLAGPPSNKRPNPAPPRGALSYDQLQAMDPRVAAIKWGCAAGAVQGQGDGGSEDGQRPYLPNDAPNGCGVVNAGIFYPSCSDGRLDSPDHFDHMRYPLDGSNGYNCPSSHPIKYPTVFMEHFYFPKSDQPYRGANNGNWILSNGDRIGTSFHADMINGWMPGSLEAVLQSCNAPNAPGEQLENCAALKKSADVSAADNCRSEGDITNEDVGLVKAITKLPGCNVWPDDQDTHPGCKDAQVSMSQPAGRYVLDEFKLALPISDQEGTGQAKSGGSSSQSSSSASTSTTSSAASTTSQPATTTTTSAAAITTTSAAATSSASTTSSEAPAAKNESSSSAAPTTTSSSADDYNYGAAPPAGSTSVSTSSSSSAASTTTASSDDYNYGAPPAAGTSSSSSASSAVPTTTASNDDYNYGAPAAAGTSTSSSSSFSAVPTTSDYNYGAPAPAPVANSNPTTTTGAATSSVIPSGSATKSINPSGIPTPQQANAGGPHKPQKTCRPKRKGKGHNRRRGWQSRLIN